MTKKRNVPSLVRRVKRVQRRKIFGAGAKSTSPGSFVYIDIAREEKRLEEESRIVIENEFTLSADEENKLEKSIDDTAFALRGSLTQLLSTIAGYDKATGQIEAIARDILETDVEHDNSVQSIAQAATQLDVLCLLTQRCKNLPAKVRDHFMLHSAQVIAGSLPDRLISQEKLSRHRQFMDNIIAVSQRMSSGEPLQQGPYISEQKLQQQKQHFPKRR